MRRAPAIVTLTLALAQHGCFAVTPGRYCDEYGYEFADENDYEPVGLFETGHVCLPLGLELPLGGAPWQLRRGVFDGDGVDDLVVGLGSPSASRQLYVITGLAGTPVLTPAASAVGMTDFIASWATGAATGPQDLIALLDDGGAIGKLKIWAHGGDLFADEPGTAYNLQGGLNLPCARPVALAAIGDGVGRDVGWGIACETGPMALGPDVGFLINPALDPKGVFVGYAEPSLHTAHAALATRLNDGAYSDVVFAAVPNDGNSDVLALTYDDDDPARPVGTLVEPGQGLISRIYAADLDGDGTDELIALHRKGDILTISRRTRRDPPTYTPVAEDDRSEFTLPTPLAAAFGDFSGDGEPDIAVGYDNEDGTHALAIYIRWPDQEAGSFRASRGAGRVLPVGERVIDVVALAADDDPALDLAVALDTPSGGVLRIYLNRLVDPV